MDELAQAIGVTRGARSNYENGYITLDKSIPADFALKIRGDNMIDYGIDDGDYVFIRIQPTLEAG